MPPRALAAYVFLALVWGLSFMIVLHVVAAFGWAGAITFRALVAGTTLFALARVMGRKLDFSMGWGRLATLGLFTVAGQLAGIAFAAPLIGTAMTAIMVSAIPLFSMLIGRILGLERLTALQIAGLVMGLAGIVLLVGFPDAPMTPAFLLGCAVSILGSLSAAIGSLYASEKLKQAGSWEMTIGSFVTGGLMTLPLLWPVPFNRVPGAADIGWLILLGALTSAACYVIYFRLVTEIGATRAISVEFVVTVVAVTAGTLVLGERLSLVQMTGALIIIAGCSMVLGFNPTRLRKSSRSQRSRPEIEPNKVNT